MNPRTRSAATLLLTAVLILTGCATQTGGVTEEDFPDQNYIAGDGTVTEIPKENRGKPISFVGVSDQGGTISSEDFEGEVLVVNFWYAACPPCRKEAPWLEELSQELKADEVEFVGVNIRDETATSQAFARNFGVTYPSVIDSDGGVSLAFAGEVSPAAVPTTLILDHEGRPAARVIGMINKSVLRTLTKTVIAEVTSGGAG